MDLLSASDKAAIHSVFDDLHDTFSREITIYKSEKGIIIDTDDGFNKNPIYGVPSGGTAPDDYVAHKIKARIRYLGLQDRRAVGVESQIGVTFPLGGIRIKVDQEGYKLITEAKKIQVDDRLCQLKGSPARPGPFSPNYWTIELQQVD